MLAEIPPALVRQAWGLLLGSLAMIAVLYFLKRGRGRGFPKPATAPAPRPEASIRALGDLLEELRKTGAAMTAGLDRRVVELKALTVEADRRIEALRALQTAPVPLPPAHRMPPPAERPLPEPVTVDPGVARELRATFDQVYRLSDQGKALADIARETGLNKGAVTLILGLRKSQAVDGPRSTGAAL